MDRICNQIICDPWVWNPYLLRGYTHIFGYFFLIYKKYRQGENVNETTTKEMVLMNLVKKGIQELQE